MPELTRLYIKLSLIYLVFALLLAALLAARPLLGLPGWINATSPVYFHTFMVGWVTQIIFGVGYWMFPKYTLEQPRGNERLNLWVFIFLNAGLLLRVIAEPLSVSTGASLWGYLLAISALVQFLAGAGFVASTWNRIKEK